MSNPANTNPPAPKAETGQKEETTLSKLYQFSPYFFALLAMCAYSFSFYNTSNFIGDAEIWITIKPQITTILISCMVGTGLLMIGAFLYFFQDERYMMYFLLFLTFATLCLSYASLAVAAISSK
jgi:hypothetical protein